MRAYRIIGISHGLNDGDPFTCSCIATLDETKNRRELVIDAQNRLHQLTQYPGVLDEVILVDASLNIILKPEE